MKTFEDQKAFFDRHEADLRRTAEDGGAEAVLAFFDGFDDDLERRVLYVFARQALIMGEGEGRSLDIYVAVTRAVTRRLLDEAAGADEEKARRRKGLANIIAYNLAADLADCWPDDGLERSRPHFEAGLAAASDCVRWREEAGGDPAGLSMAWWAKGMHELSLGDARSAVASFARSLVYAEKESDSESDFGVVLGRGYLGIARRIHGDPSGLDAFRDALRIFANQLLDEKHKEDARLGIDQLETVKSRYASTVSSN